MASTQESTVYSFEFSSYIEEDTTQVTARAIASINQEQTTTNPRRASDEFDDDGTCSIASQKSRDQLDSSDSEDAVSNRKSVLQRSHDRGQSDAEPVKRPVNITSLLSVL
jgi:hypothetical protein